MATPFSLGSKKSLRACGYDEKWLEDQIASKPAILGLGDNLVAYQQCKQPKGGRLDLLLEDTASDDGAMYEVELMLGQTDASHIVRTIEYWDEEKRRRPRRSHTAVLVAETITSRFFNVIHLLSDAVPIIAIQVEMIEADGRYVLHFSKILDTYQEPAMEPETAAPANEDYWRETAPETLKMAKRLQETLAADGGPFTLYFTKGYISLNVGTDNWVWLHRLAHGKSRLNFWVTEQFLSQATACLEQAELDYQQRDNCYEGIRLHFMMRNNELDSHAKCLKRLCQLGKESLRSYASESQELVATGDAAPAAAP